MTPYQLLGKVRDVTGHTLPIRPYSSCEDVLIGETQVVVKWKLARVRETRGADVITHIGTRIDAFVQRNGVWHPLAPLVVWDEVEPIRVDRYTGTPRNEAEQREWERLCYRPGNSAFPMDGPRGSNPSVR